MSDPDVERELAANEQRAENAEKAQEDDGIVGTVERAFSFLGRDTDDPDNSEQAEEMRRENDAEQRG